MTRAEIRQTVVTADRLDVRHSALATEVARGSEIHLKGLGALRATVKVWNSGPSHLHVLAAEKEQQAVTHQTDYVGDQNELHRALRPQLQPLQHAPAEEDPDTGARDRDRAREDARLTLPQAELRLEILGQKYHEAGYDYQLHAGSQTRHDVHWVAHEPPHAPWNICRRKIQANIRD